MPALEHAHEGLLRKIDRVGLVTDVAIDEIHKRLLPACHQFVQRGVFAIAEAQHQCGVHVVFIQLITHVNGRSPSRSYADDRERQRV